MIVYVYMYDKNIKFMILVRKVSKLNFITLHKQQKFEYEGITYSINVNI